MAISIKNKKEIEIMRKGGEKLSSILFQLIQLIKPKTNLLDIEKKAVELIEKAKGKPAFMKVPGYNWATCLNVNEEIVHGVPKDYQIKSGDVVNIDIGLFYKGFNTDMSSTIEVKDKIVKLMGDLPRIELFAREKTQGWDIIEGKDNADGTGNDIITWINRRYKNE